MVRTLVLTENVENELVLYEQLRRLKHEAFLTNELFVYWQQYNHLPSWVKIFQAIILSETIPQKEAKEISVLLKKNKQTIFLKVDGILSTEEKEEWKALGVSYCFSTEAPLSEMRELLFKYSPKIPDFILEEKKVVTFDHFYKQLPQKDRQIISTLLKTKNTPIARKELAEVIWHKSNNSELSQLSLRMKKLNRKIQKIFGTTDAIMTVWGQGYSLNEEFYTAHEEELNVL